MKVEEPDPRVKVEEEEEEEEAEAEAEDQEEEDKPLPEEEEMAHMAPGKKRFKQMDPDAFFMPPQQPAPIEEDAGDAREQNVDVGAGQQEDQEPQEDEAAWVPAKKRREGF